MGVSSRFAIALSSVLVAMLALAAGPAAALGLGQLQVKSRPGQPLVAEIPIISNDPSELQGLQVQLAPPETFTRVGLEPPAAAVSSLRFEPAVDAAGRPVIRVTSAEAVAAPLLTFLLQVDWSQGRLVREYSALLDAPNTVAATAQPAIQAPTAAPGNSIPRAPVVVQAPPPAPTPTPSTPAPTPPLAPPPAPSPVVPAPAADIATAPAAPVPSIAAEPGRTEPVKPGQTLGQIASGLQLPGRHSTAQVMLALLRDNPGAFINGNVNLLRQGAVLNIPSEASLADVDRGEAAAAVHEQIVQWRALQVPRAQPVASEPATVPSGQVTKAPAIASADKPARTLGARLEIAPSSAAGHRRAGTQSGVEAGGEGEMLRQQLQETKETLAARDAEVNELKTRVAELEKLQQQQQQLLTLKDSALASAQQTLAKSNQTAAPVATQPVAPPATPVSSGSGALLLWSGLALVVVALVGWLLTRQRRKVAAPRRAFDTAALAAGIPGANPVRGPLDADPPGDLRPDPLVSPRPIPATTAARTTPAAVVSPPWHDPAAAATVTEAEPAIAANRQLEAAQSCLSRGDDDAARVLLREILDGRDPVAREAAARLLRDL